jgi:hypothetical protein
MVRGGGRKRREPLADNRNDCGPLRPVGIVTDWQRMIDAHVLSAIDVPLRAAGHEEKQGTVKFINVEPKSAFRGEMECLLFILTPFPYIVAAICNFKRRFPSC